MKYFFLVCTLLLMSCKDPLIENDSSVDLVTVSSEKEIISSEISNNQDLIKVVDYKGLAPLLAKRNDTTYVVNFWATWCKPCIKELPAFEKIDKTYAGQKIKVVLVSLDFPDKLEKQVIPFIEKNSIKSEVILLDDADANSWIPAIDKTWSGAIPVTIIYNKNKRTFYERSFTYEELEKEVKTIL